MKFAAFLIISCAAAQAAGPLSLWYREPAAQWVEALPVGCGRMGAMVFGGVKSERIQFNEHTVWTGEPHDYAHPGASKHLNTLREMLFQGRQAEAEKLALQEFMSVPLRQKTYQAFGDLLLEFPGVAEAPSPATGATSTSTPPSPRSNTRTAACVTAAKFSRAGPRRPSWCASRPARQARSPSPRV